MSAEKSDLVRLELKYCENCGALCLRKTGDLVIYCRACRQSALDSTNSILTGASRVVN